MEMTTSPVLQLGDPRLRQRCTPVSDVDRDFAAKKERLCATLEAFRRQHGFGCGIAAPQIGIPERFIALNLGQDPFVVVNPEVTWRSDETFTLLG